VQHAAVARWMESVLASFEEEHPVLAARDTGSLSPVLVPPCDPEGIKQTITEQPPEEDIHVRRLMAGSDWQGQHYLRKRHAELVTLDVKKWRLAVNQCTGESSKFGCCYSCGVLIFTI
jgi:hypothetical protein